jgi:hypothetical protein
MEENIVPQENQGYYYLPTYRVGEEGLVKLEETSNIGMIRFVTGIARKPSQSEVEEAKEVMENSHESTEAYMEAKQVIQMSMVPDWSGLLHGDLLKCLIADLNMRGPHNYGVAMAITKLQEAAMWMGFKG